MGQAKVVVVGVCGHGLGDRLAEHGHGDDAPLLQHRHHVLPVAVHRVHHEHIAWLVVVLLLVLLVLLHHLLLLVPELLGRLATLLVLHNRRGCIRIRLRRVVGGRAAAAPQPRAVSHPRAAAGAPDTVGGDAGTAAAGTPDLAGRAPRPGRRARRARNPSSGARHAERAEQRHHSGPVGPARVRHDGDQGHLGGAARASVVRVRSITSTSCPGACPRAIS